jgi:hypothetical protein
MTPEKIKTDIAAWCNDKTGLQLVEDRTEPGAELAFALRAGGAGSASVPVDVRLDDGDDRVTVSSTSTGGADAKAIDGVLATRPALVHAQSSGGNTVVTSYVYTDGFSKHAFISAVEEVAKTRSLIDALTGATAGAETAAAVAQTPAVQPQPEPIAAQPQPASQPQPWSQGALPQQTVQQPTAASLPAPSFASPSPAAGGYAPLSGQPAPQAQPAAAAFAPTHTVPPQGMQAWAAPDPSGAVVARAHILCSNGWTGWVDGRIIGVAR